jgi:hypothetical protein
MILDWLKAISGLGSIAGFLKSLLLPLAYLYGRWVAFKAQYEANERLQEKYDEIEAKPLTDEDIDNRLDAGTL